MKLIIAIPFLALSAPGVYSQQRSDAKPSSEKAVVANTEKAASAKDAKARMAKETRMKEFDVNFRAQEQRVRHSIYTLGGKLTPPGKKPGEGC